MRALLTKPLLLTVMLSIKGEYKGNILSTPIPPENFLTVNVSGNSCTNSL